MGVDIGGRLTPRQENFARRYVECGFSSEAYRKSYRASHMKPATIHKRACELLASGKIAGRVKELQQGLREQFEINVGTITLMLLDDRQFAVDEGNASAAVAATTALARIYGVDKQVHVLKVNPVQKMLDEIAENSAGFKIIQHVPDTGA